MSHVLLLFIVPQLRVCAQVRSGSVSLWHLAACWWEKLMQIGCCKFCTMQTITNYSLILHKWDSPGAELDQTPPISLTPSPNSNPHNTVQHIYPAWNKLHSMNFWVDFGRRTRIRSDTTTGTFCSTVIGILVTIQFTMSLLPLFLKAMGWNPTTATTEALRPITKPRTAHLCAWLLFLPHFLVNVLMSQMN